MPILTPPHSALSTVSAITGSTAVYLIVGDPIEQVLAPQMFNPIFAHFGIDAVLVPVQVSPDQLPLFAQTVLKATSVQGLWVTIPHKSTIMEILDRCSPIATIAGAVNAVRRNADGSLEGDLLDGVGFMASLARFGIPYNGRRTLILGAGGAAAAIAVSLAQAGCSEIALYDPAANKAELLAQRVVAATQVRVYAADSSDPAGFDLVINASPLGMFANDPLPCDATRLERHAVVVDILMKNQPTPLVQAAHQRGLQAEAGFEMLLQQAHGYLNFFGFTHAAEQVRLNAIPFSR